MVQHLLNSGFKKHNSVLREASHKYISFLCQNSYSTCTSQVRKDEHVEGYTLKLRRKISHIFVWLLITTTYPTHFPAQHVYKSGVKNDKFLGYKICESNYFNYLLFTCCLYGPFSERGMCHQIYWRRDHLFYPIKPHILVHQRNNAATMLAASALPFSLMK
jgi:hypothetical protein